MKWVALGFVIVGSVGLVAALRFGREDTADHNNALTRYSLNTSWMALGSGVAMFLIIGFSVLP